MNLSQFIKQSRDEMRNGTSIDRFFELRYKILHKQFPHGTFSVEQGTLDFFEQTYNYIFGLEKLPDANSEYVSNYVNWIKQAQTEK